jgi:hypothetical protein
MFISAICDLDEFDDQLKYRNILLFVLSFINSVLVIAELDNIATALSSYQTVVPLPVTALLNSALLVLVVHSIFRWIRIERTTDLFGVTQEVEDMLNGND